MGFASVRAGGSLAEWKAWAPISVQMLRGALVSAWLKSKGHWCWCRLGLGALLGGFRDQDGPSIWGDDRLLGSRRGSLTASDAAETKIAFIIEERSAAKLKSVRDEARRGRKSRGCDAQQDSAAGR